MMGETVKGVSISTTIHGPKRKETIGLGPSLAQIAEAGYEWIEISRKHGDLKAHAGTIYSHGLKVWAVHGTLGGGHIYADEAARRASVEKEIRHMEDAAVYAPCPYVIHYTSRFHDPRAGVAFRKSIEELLVRAEPLGIDLAIETVPDKDQNERFPESKEVSDFARSFESEFVSICLDINHSNLAEDLAQVARNCDGLISDIHVSDNHGKLEDHLPPGEGSIDLPAAMQAIADAGYAGPLNLECHTPDYPTLAQLVEMRQWAEATVAGLRQ